MVDSRSDAAPEAGPSKPRIPYSSAAHIHHLHTDPSSHHITLAATRHGSAGLGVSRSGSGAASDSPKSLNIPLEPTVAEPNVPVARPGHSRSVSKSHTSPVMSSSEPMAGPSTLKPLVRGASKKGRPKTAPGKQEQLDLLQDASMADSPDTESGHALDSPLPLLASTEPGTPTLEEPGLQPEEMDPRRSLLESHEDPNRRPSLDVVKGRAASPSTSVHLRLPPVVERHGWNTFAQAYSHGLFDPNKIPVPPSEINSPPYQMISARSSPGNQYSSFARPEPSSGSESLSTIAASSTSGTSGSSSSFTTVSSSAPSSSIEGKRTSSPMDLPASRVQDASNKKKAFELESLVDRPPTAAAQPPRPDTLSLPSYSFAAATVRMASAPGTNIAPLVMPSPDRELADPLASLITPDHPASTGSLRMSASASSDPGTHRHPFGRSMSTTVRSGLQVPLPTIAATPLGTPLEHPASRSRQHSEHAESSTSSPPSKGGVSQHRIPPATAPIAKSPQQDEGDYFGNIAPRIDRNVSYTSSSSSSQQTATAAATPMHPAQRTPRSPESAIPEKEDSPELTRAPFAADIGGFYDDLGWMPAPLPPNEEARRRALYRFNILGTAPDANFDRIAHLTKLVFGTRVVLISLLDSEVQYNKARSGWTVEECARGPSFCSHAILSSSDEPLVVLDTLNDWRFAAHPLVVGPPHMRFYAGAPLRTSDGHNVGTLCIFDDKPRTEFPPRLRLIIKEFAAIAMREMELWRDKLQLRVRDKIQTSMEQFTRYCLEMDVSTGSSNVEAAARMDQVFSRAAELVCSTLEMEGAFILNLDHFEQMEVETERGKKTIYRADPFATDQSSPIVERNEGFGAVNGFPVLATTPAALTTRDLSPADHERFSEFLSLYQDGRIYENVAPSWIKYMFPSNMRYGMVAPIFGLDQQPFAMICAFTTGRHKQYLEGYELQFLRAIGVIILSAVLRRRMVLADKAKSILISSVSHELRTPLHGILAAAELLKDTQLDPSQASFLRTVQTCGNSLIETVNHVLDFTKLSSGSSQSTSRSSLKLEKYNLARLVEETVESSWIGQRARTYQIHNEEEGKSRVDPGVGTIYDPEHHDGPDTPTGSERKDPIAERSRTASASSWHPQRESARTKLDRVETVIDIASRERGWWVRCEKGGLRRVLMNLVGNSLKFTTDGYVQVTLRELPHPTDPHKLAVEMAVIDTGKGIGKEFLKDQLFHPFSQENPLQTGTGLGLAIVNSIVRSESVDGKVDVWSSEGVGTEIRVSFEVSTLQEDEIPAEEYSSRAERQQGVAPPEFAKHRTLSLLGFNGEHRGQALALEVLGAYAAGFGFILHEAEGDVLLINGDEDILEKHKDDVRPIVFLQTVRSAATHSVQDYIMARGGSCQILYKPVGPSDLQRALWTAIRYVEHGPQDLPDRPLIFRGSSLASDISSTTQSTISSSSHAHSQIRGDRDKRLERVSQEARIPLPRRRSEEKDYQSATPRPSMAPRGVTYHHPNTGVMTSPKRDSRLSSWSSTASSASHEPGSPTSTLSTISLGEGAGTMLKAILGSADTNSAKKARIMLVEDNAINRDLVVHYLHSKVRLLSRLES